MRIKIHLFLIFGILLFDLACKRHGRNNPSSENDTGVYGSECGDVLPIYVTQIPPTDSASFKVRKYMLHSEDTQFNSSVQDLSLTDDDIYEMFLQMWNSDQDWYMNAFLYSRYQQSAFEMKKYEPCNAPSWRVGDKKECFNFWSEYLRNTNR